MTGYVTPEVIFFEFKDDQVPEKTYILDTDYDNYMILV